MRSDIYALTLQGTLNKRACGDKRRRDASAEVTAATCILKAVIFFIRGIVAVPRSCLARERRIILAVGVGVWNDNAYGRARRFAVINATQNTVLIALSSCGRNFPVWTAKRELCGYILLVHLNAGGDTINNGSYCRAVTFTEKRNGQGISEYIFHIKVITSLLCTAISRAVIFC